VAAAALATTIAVTGPAQAATSPGGFSFNSATDIAAGSYSESLVVGDFLFWKVDIKAGQKLTVTGSVDVPADFPYIQGPRFVVNLYNPLRETIPLLDNPPNQLRRGGGRYQATSGAWTVGDGKKYENFDGTRGEFKEFKDDKYALPGPYYIQVAISGAEGAQRGIVVPVKLDVTLENTDVQRPDAPAEFDFGAQAPIADAPAETAPAPSDDVPAAPVAAETDDETSFMAAWGAPGGGALLAFVLAGFGALLLRRRMLESRRAPSGIPSWAQTAAVPGPPPAPSWQHVPRVPESGPQTPPSPGLPSTAPPPPTRPTPPAPPAPPATAPPPAAAPQVGGASPWARLTSGESSSASRATAPGSAPESFERTEEFDVPPRRPEQPPTSAPRVDPG